MATAAFVLPSALVHNLIDGDVEEDVESTTSWMYIQEETRGLLKSNTNIRLEIKTAQICVHLHVLQAVCMKLCNNDLNIEERLMQAFVSEEFKRFVPAIVEALNFSANLSVEFWHFCAYVVDRSTIKNPDVLQLLTPSPSLSLWQVANKFPCEAVLKVIFSTQPIEYMIDHCIMLTWDKTNEHLWLDLFLHLYLHHHGKNTRISQLIFDCVPEDLHYKPKVVDVFIKNKCFAPLKRLLITRRTEVVQLAEACVEYLCSPAGRYDKSLFDYVAPSLQNESLWWELVTAFRHPQIHGDDVNVNYLLSSCEIPDRVFSTLCTVPDDECRTLRLAVHANTCVFNKWRFAPGTYTIYF